MTSLPRAGRALLLALGLGAGQGSSAARAVVAPPDPTDEVWRADPIEADILFRYNRVDGATPGARLRWQSPDRRARRAALEVTWAGARRRGLYELRGGQDFGGGNAFGVSAAAWRRTAGFEFDDERVGNLENTLSALLLADDNRDHLDARGGQVALAWRPTRPTSLSLTYRRERQRPLPNEADAALFNAGPFRANPAAACGTLSALRLDAEIDPRTGLSDEGAPFVSVQRRPRGYRVRARLESAGSGLGGDFRYSQVRVDAGIWWPVMHGQSVAARLLAGRALSGRLPPQNDFAAGGAATLRGHRYKQFRGDRIAVVNIEYAATLHRALEALVLLDSGAAWRSAAAPRGVRWALDAGGGLQTHDQRLRVLLARPLRDSGAPWILSVRTRATF